MENVTDRVGNPFGMDPPCPHSCTRGGDRRAVLGYGDANAEFHVVGDHPGVHGGTITGIPFTGTNAGEAILNVLETVGLVTRVEEDIALDNTYLSYYHCCCVPTGTTPSDEDYRDFERFFDAELRAIAADVLLPVGRRTIRHVLQEYTAQSHRLDPETTNLHGREIRGRGFLVMPIADPRDWEDGDFDRIIDAIRTLRSKDYHQLVDLGRFTPGSDPFLTR